MKHTRDTFLVRANEVHNSKYDYSKMQYVDQKTPIVIVCPDHGDFEQKPSYHLAGGGCPVCAQIRIHAPKTEEQKAKRRETNLRKYGATTFAGSKAAKDLHAAGGGAWSKEARQKAADTCMERFGAKTWAESDTGREALKEMCADDMVRQKMSERARSDAARAHYKSTSEKHFGVGHWTQSDAGKARLHAMFSTEQERLARSQRMLSEEVRLKIQATSMERYGTPYYWQSEDARKRLSEILRQEDVQQRIIETKKKKGTINSSKPERMAYELLVQRFGKADVEQQYKSDERYPYACDFYVRSLDLFIELNASWLHCGHWFDEDNEDDRHKLDALMEKANQSKPMYARAIYIWTYDDLRKLAAATENSLNYLVFWDNDLKDFKEWLESI